MHGNLHDSKFIFRKARDFRACLFHFRYPHNSYLFSGIPQIDVAADKNNIIFKPCPALKQTFTDMYFYVPTLASKNNL